MSVELGPNHRYYQRNHGRWRSRFSFELTDWRGFWAASMSARDRVQVLALVLLPKLIGRFWMETEVVYPPGEAGEVGEVVHTTRIAKWGVTLFASRERFELDANGRDVAITGSHRSWPARRFARAFADSHARIDETGTRATYEFAWFGTRLVQTGEIADDQVVITMTTPWARGVQRLRRL